MRRFPQLSVSASGSEFEIDWANIRTPLIKAIANRIKFTAQPDYANIKELDHSPGTDPNDDKSLIYSYNDIYWYWNGNEWKGTLERDIFSEFSQTPAGFSLKGVLELLTDTGGRLTISDSFIKMYPAGNDDPKIQFGYDDKSEHNNPVVILGAGSDLEKPAVEIKGYPVKWGQSIIFKTDISTVIGMVGNKVEEMEIDGGIKEVLVTRMIELRGSGYWPWCYYTERIVDPENEMEQIDEKEYRFAMHTDIDNLQQQIDGINERIDDLQGQINALGEE